MGLSNDLISQFVKVTKATDAKKDESTVYGTTKIHDGQMYVKLDGSDLLTPVSTTAVTEADERVVVLIKDHSATITGNMSSPAARNSTVTALSGDVTKMGADMAEFNTVLASKISVTELDAVYAQIELLTATDADIYRLTATFLTAEDADFKYVSTDQLEADYITAAEIDALYVSTNKLEADYMKAAELEATYATITSLDATKASIDDLYAVKMDVETVQAEYANIDFANIGEAAIESFYSKAGVIENLVFSEGHVTGDLVGVNISGDLITANTIKADKLVVLGEDGVYYKLNLESGGFAEGEEIPTDGLDGRILVAKSVTANEIYVDDLVAFDATIGGFSITESSIHSGVKSGVDNATGGIYMDSEGQFSVGDETNYLKYYRGEDEKWHFAVSAEDFSFAGVSASRMAAVAERITLGTYTNPDTGNTQPSLELAEGDTDYKQVLTNTSTVFMYGSATKTKLDTDGLETGNVTLSGELRHGKFAWIYDESTGNYDLEYKG